jgi:hypothetical protein
MMATPFPHIPAPTRSGLVVERIEARLAEILLAVPPLNPGLCYWLHEDATESFCRKHVIEERGRAFDLGAPLRDSEFYDRDDWEDAFWEGIGATEGGESDHTEACARCGETLSYVLTDGGMRSEIDYYLEAPLVIIRDEDSYALDRLALNIWGGSPRGDIVGVAAAVNQAWRIIKERRS